jgi:cell division protein FtsB
VPRAHDADDDAVPRSWRRSALRAVGAVAAGVAVVAGLAIGVFPTRTWLDQRQATEDATERLRVLRAQNDALEERIERLQTAEEIERIAREQYNLVMPGEEAYAVLPPPLPPIDLPPVFPFGELLPDEDAGGDGTAAGAEGRAGPG